MSLPALYTLAHEYRHAADQLAELDLDEATIHDTLEGLAGDIETKGTNVAFLIGNFDAQADAIKKAEAAMSARRKAIENRAARLRQYLLDNMLVAGISKIECPYFRIAVRDNPASVVIDDESKLHPDYFRQPEPPPAVPDKTLIAKAIKSGAHVTGARLERGKRIEIK